jgi:hypothetical protein
VVDVVLLIAVLSAVVAVDNAYPATPAPVVAAEPVPKTTEPVTVLRHIISKYKCIIC